MSNNDAFSLAGKTFLVTGGTRGIGRAISIRFAEAGGSVIAVYVRNQEAAGSLKAEAGERGLQIECLRADLTRPAGMEAIDGLLTGLDTNLSGLVHCAATGVHKDADRFSSRDIKWVFSLNFEAFVGLVSMLLPRMDEGSSIIALSKIRVNIITPGPVLTEAWDVLPNRDERLGAAVARTPLGRLVLPEDVAYTAQFLCCDASSGIVGHTLVVDGGADLPE
jgi:NAD(P)-dependent dehydrogenase (short-subunit alcohol dehydrogenase family)